VPAPDAESDADPSPVDDAAVEAPTGDAAVVQARDDALARVHRDLVRRTKRAVQDEQNELLDVLRKQRGNTTPDKVLPGLDDQLIAWAEVVRPGVETAYAAAGRATTGRDVESPVPTDLVDDLVRSLVLPLRERVYDALLGATDDGSDDDVTQRINARYREWKAGVEAAVGDTLTAAWARGTLDVAPEGARLRWVPAREGRCPDCDDNALEPTTRGEAFPTGQPHPPAHPGCRCVLVVDLDAAIGVGGDLEVTHS
jgi:hypothetical protein